MTIDWKKFADEVPTEAKDVLVRYERNDGKHIYEPWILKGDEWVDGVSPDEPTGIVSDWGAFASNLRAAMQNTRLVHWAYVDPPEDT